MICLYCDADIITQTTWRTFLFPPKQRPICADCSDELYVLSGNRCRICARESQDTVCRDCVWWRGQFPGGDVLNAHGAVFGYNDFMKAVIAKWKYRGDYELGYMFAEVFRDAFEKQYSSLKKDCLIIPVPLSAERLKERAFNQAEMLAGFLTDHPVLIVERLKGEKQSKKTRQERIASENLFRVNEPVNKPVILVDDIYTTGTTLRHIARQLKSKGCPAVYGLTLVRG